MCVEQSSLCAHVLVTTRVVDDSAKNKPKPYTSFLASSTMCHAKTVLHVQPGVLFMVSLHSLWWRTHNTETEMSGNSKQH